MYYNLSDGRTSMSKYIHKNSADIFDDSESTSHGVIRIIPNNLDSKTI